MEGLKKTALHEAHRRGGAKLIAFVGWEMPLHFGSILDEAKTVRASCGMFDVSHMGRFFVAGQEAANELNRLFTMDVAGLKVGQVRYGLLCNEQGGIIDDGTVARLSESYFLIVINAARREADFEWIKQHLSENTQLLDQTFETAMIAVQGPDAMAIVDGLVDGNDKLSELKRFRWGEFSLTGVRCQISRTGYTGEDGVEIICPSEEAKRIWDALRAKGVQPCGLGARDILRLEAGMCLYGHDLTEDITPAEADLMRFVAMGKEFIGRKAITEQLEQSIKRKRVGLRLQTRAIAREGTTVLHNGRPIGFVTSGAFSPHLNTSIAMAYVAVEFSEVGTRLQVMVRETLQDAEVVSMPFLPLPSRKG